MAQESRSQEDFQPVPVEPPDVIAIPDVLFSEALREIDPIFRPTTGKRLKELRRHDGQMCDVSRALVQALIEHIVEGEGDPTDLALALEGRAICPACGDYGFVWNKERDEHEKCPWCEGVGKVPMDKVAEIVAAEKKEMGDE